MSPGVVILSVSGHTVLRGICLFVFKVFWDTYAEILTQSVRAGAQKSALILFFYILCMSLHHALFFLSSSSFKKYILFSFIITIYLAVLCLCYNVRDLSLQNAFLSSCGSWSPGSVVVAPGLSPEACGILIP